MRGKLWTGRFKSILFGAVDAAGGGESSGPSLFEASLKMKRNSAHGVSSGFAVAPRVKASTHAGL
jgi:hypothetical protein